MGEKELGRERGRGRGRERGRERGRKFVKERACGFLSPSHSQNVCMCLRVRACVCAARCATARTQSASSFTASASPGYLPLFSHACHTLACMRMHMLIHTTRPSEHAPGSRVRVEKGRVGGERATLHQTTHRRSSASRGCPAARSHKKTHTCERASASRRCRAHTRRTQGAPRRASTIK